MVSMARPKDQTARRKDLVNAASRAIVEVGLAGLRVRDVAEQAETSAGLVTYYFQDLGELTFEVHADAVRRFYLARKRAVDAMGDPRRQLFELARLGVPVSRDDLTCRVLYEFHLHATRSSTHAVLMTSLWEQEVSLYELVLQRGIERRVFQLRTRVREVAETAVALEDAVGLHVVARNAAMTPESALRLVVGLLERETSAQLGEPVAPAGWVGGCP